MKCGIYKYENLINHKCYIGQSTRIERRINEHNCIPYCPNSKDYNAAIHQAIRKYGLENFSIEILEECNPEELNEKEKFYIKKYNSYSCGYNQNEGGDQTKYLGKIIHIYDLAGKYLTTVQGVQAAMDFTGYGDTSIRMACRGTRTRCGPYQMKYDGDSRLIQEHPDNKYQIKKKIFNKAEPLLQISLDGKIIKEWPSSREASRQTGINNSQISKVVNGKGKTAGGYIWKRKHTGYMER